MAGKLVTVWGLGTFGGGVAAARHLARGGARLRVIDRKSREQLAGSLEALAGLPIEYRLGREHEREDFLGSDLIVRNPAIPPSSPWLELIREKGIPTTAEIVLGLEQLQVPFAMVTGSKGKTTTTTLLGRLLGSDTAVAGNNERPLLAALENQPRRVCVEVSSFMGEAIAQAGRGGWRCPAPQVLAFTSLGPEHLNWHGTVEDYYEAKLSLLDLGPRQVAIPATDPELTSRVPGRWGQRPILVGSPVGDQAPGDVVVEDGWVVQVQESGSQPVFRLDTLQLLGAHNQINALVATGAALAMGAAPKSIAERVAGFSALPHRLETVAVRQGVRLVNDSTATTPEAAIAGLRAVPQPVVLMAGGSDKGADYTLLGEEVARRARAVVCLGQVGERIAAAAEAAVGRGLGAVKVVRVSGGFDEAFQEAFAHCEQGSLLLSPAAASYDMFTSFKARGERFRELAIALDS